MTYPILNATSMEDTHPALHNEHVNVKAHFGAVGDGVTDDWQAITDAIATADTDGATVFFPPGTYKVSQTLDLTALNFQHWVGGHLGDTGLIQFSMPPSVVIDGRGMAGGAGPVVYLDGGPSHAGGNHTFENLIFWGKDQGLQADQAARVKFINCGFKSTAASGTDVCGLFMSRCFWFRFESCTFHNTDGSNGPGALPSVILRAETGTNIESCALMEFHWCVFSGGPIQYDVNVVPSDGVGNLQFYGCLTENLDDPWITFTENIPGNTTTYPIKSMVFENCEMADSGVADAPIIEMDTPYGYLYFPVFRHVSNPGFKTVLVTQGRVTNPVVGAFGGNIYNAAGTGPTGKAVTFKHNGLLITGDSELLTETTVIANAGPSIKMAKENEAHASFGLDVTGIHYWGPGGAGGTWDTNLYRSAADTLKTDDAFTTTLALTAGKALVQKQINLTEASPVVVDASLGSIFQLRTGSTLTIGPPTNGVAGQVIHFVFLGNGSMVLTWDSEYHLAGAWTNPGNSKWRSISFVMLTIPGIGDRWVELSRAAADIT